MGIPSGDEERDVRSTVAFSLLFVVPAAVAVAFWMVLRVLDATIGLGSLTLIPWLLVVVSPAILSAAIAHWASRRAGASVRAAWRFTIAAALVTPLFTLVAAAWLLNDGE